MLYKFLPIPPVLRLVFNNVSVERVKETLYTIATHQKDSNFEQIAVRELNTLVQEICPTHNPSTPLFVTERDGGPPVFHSRIIIKEHKNYSVEKTTIRTSTGEEIIAATKILRLRLESQYYSKNSLSSTGKQFARKTLQFLKEMIVAQEMSRSKLGPELLFCDYDLFEEQRDNRTFDCISIHMSTKFMDMGDGYVVTGKLLELLDGEYRSLRDQLICDINNELEKVGIGPKDQYNDIKRAARDLRLYIVKQILDKYSQICKHARLLSKDVKLENLLLDSNDGVVFWDFAGWGPVDDPETRSNWDITTPDRAPPEHGAPNDNHYSQLERALSTRNRILYLNEVGRRRSAEFMLKAFNEANRTDKESVAQASVVYMVFNTIHDVLEGNLFTDKVADIEARYAAASKNDQLKTPEAREAAKLLQHKKGFAAHATMFNRRALMIDFAMDETVPDSEAQLQRTFLGMGLVREPENRISPDKIKETGFYKMLDERFQDPRLGQVLMTAFKPIFDVLPDIR